MNGHSILSNCSVAQSSKFSVVLSCPAARAAVQAFVRVDVRVDARVAGRADVRAQAGATVRAASSVAA